jgi:hypothetical protein
LNCHDVAIHCKFDARGIVLPNTATTSAAAVGIKMAIFTGAERARCVFWFEETRVLGYRSIGPSSILGATRFSEK